MKPKPRMSFLTKCALMLIFCALILPFAKDQWDARWRADQKKSGEIDWSQSKDEISKSLDALAEKSNAEQAAIIRKFQKDLNAVQKKNRNGALWGMNDAAKEILKTSSIKLLLYDFAHDKYDGGQRAQGHMEVYLKPFVRNLKHTNIRVNDLLNRLILDLETLNNQYAQQAGEIIREKENSLPKADFDTLMQTTETIPKKIAIQVGSATVATVLEVVLIKTTAAATKSMVRLLAVKLAPQIAKLVTGGTAAVADGPLPFGDALAVALAVWTVWDLAHLSDDIRDDVRNELHTVRKSYMNQQEKDTEEYLKKLIKEASHSREKLNQILMSQLSQR